MSDLDRIKLRVPVALATGKYEELTDTQLRSHHWDIIHEVNRRGLDLRELEESNEEDTRLDQTA